MKRWNTALVFAVVLAGSGAVNAQGGDLGLSLAAGLVDPNGAGAAPWLAVGAVKGLRERVTLEPELGFWQRKDSQPGVENSVSDASAGLNVLYRLTGNDRRARTRVFAGAGAGLHVIRSEASLTGFDVTRQTELKQGIHLIAGVERKLGGALAVFVSVRSDLVADLPQSKVYGGIRLVR